MLKAPAKRKAAEMREMNLLPMTEIAESANKDPIPHSTHCQKRAVAGDARYSFHDIPDKVCTIELSHCSFQYNTASGDFPVKHSHANPNNVRTAAIWRRKKKFGGC